MRYVCFLFFALALTSLPVLAQDSLNISKLAEVPFDWDVTWDVAIDWEVAYLADGKSGLRVVDVSNPIQPRQVGRLRTPGEARCLAISGSYVFLGGPSVGGRRLVNGQQVDNCGFYIVDANDPATPDTISFCQLDSPVQDLLVSREFLFVSQSDYRNDLYEIRIFDASNLDTLRLVRLLEFERSVGEMTLSGDYLFVVANSGFEVVDLWNPREARIWASVETDYDPEALAVRDFIVYLNGDNCPLIALDISNPAEPVELGRAQEISYGSQATITIAGHFAWVGKEYGCSIYDIRDPANIEYVRYLNTSSAARKIILNRSQAFIAAERAGLDIYNVANLDNITLTGRLVFPSSPQDVSVWGNHAYLGNGSGGLVIMDLSDLRHPTMAGYQCSSVFDALCLNGFLYTSGGYIAGFDLTNAETPECIWSDGSNGYYLSTNGNLLALSGFYDSTYVFDVSTPDFPALTGAFQFYAGETAWCGDWLLAANGGLTIYDFSRPFAPERLSIYDDPLYARCVAVKDSLALVGLSTGNEESPGALSILDFRNPNRLREISILDLPGSPQQIKVTQELAFIACGSLGVEVIDVSDPAQPVEVGFYRTSGVAYDLEVFGTALLVADYTNFTVLDCSRLVSAPRESPAPPAVFLLNPAYPNPFNSTTAVTFDLPRAGPTRITVLDALGRRISELLPAVELSAGRHTISWDGAGAASGQYIIRLQAGDRAGDMKVTLVK